MGMFSIDEHYDYYKEQEIRKNCGRWQVDDDGWVICSCCKEELPYIITKRATFDRPYPRKDYIDRTKYCPNCGAQMANE